MLKRLLFTLALTLTVSAVLFAQITTSSLTGTVKSTTDENLVGATVVATHMPSGTRYATTSRSGGVFSLANMKPGGPYHIEVSFVGYDLEKYDDIYLQLAESFILTPALKKTNATLENVVVTTSGRRNVFNPDRMSAVTNLNLRTISTSPSIARSINDFTRATPQSNGAAIGGGNYRQNNFTIDGADFNNGFGIGTNLPANGSPISIDAVDEISVNINPYDIRLSGFVGSAINAVTRSGTNTLSGSIYKYFHDQRDRGRKVDKAFFTRPNENFSQIGGRLGGALIKNKLFFFINYETETQPKPINTKFAATAAAPYGSATNIARPTADSLNYISQYLLTNYGYVTGPFDNYTPNITRKKYLGRIDWNINHVHHLILRYSQVEGGEPNPASTSVGGAGTVAGASGTRQDLTALVFKNSNYFQGANFYSFAAELSSNFKTLSNVLRATYTYQNDSRNTESQIFPFVDILSTGGGVAPQSGSGAGNVYTSFGYEPFSYLNLRKVKAYSIVDNMTWAVKKHHWLVGAQTDFGSTINGFQRFGTSYYRFGTWADFASALNPNPALRKLPTDFTITYSLSKGFTPAFSSFKVNQYSLYGQDEISITKNFRLTLGVRLELPHYPSVPQILTHPLALAMTFANGEKINTGVLPHDRVMFSPRMGFNWDVYGNRSLQIRGGTGIFTGKIPNVWVVAQSGDDGMIQITQAFNMYTSTGALSGVSTPGPFSPDPTAYRPTTVPVAGTLLPANITVLSPNFRNPQTWKSGLAMDTKLPFGIIASFDFILNRELHAAFFRSPNYQAPQLLNIVGYPDNREMFGATVPTRFINTLNAAGIPTAGGNSPFTPVIIDNASRGYYASFTAQFIKPFSKGFTASAAYTKSMAATYFDGNGDQVLGAYQGTQIVNGLNTPQLATSQFVLPDRVLASISYRREFFKHMATTLSLFYQGSIDFRYSYTYGGDFNRDGVTGNDLMYIPTATDVQNMVTNNEFVSQVVNGVTYSNTAQGALLEAFIQQDKYLSHHRGQYAERNGAQAPWRNQMDAKLMQDVFVKIGKDRHTFQFTIDVFNMGNMLNPSWGLVRTTNSTSPLAIQNATSLVPGGTVLPTFKLGTFNGQILTRTFSKLISTSSTYLVQFGLRYLLN